MLSDKHNDIPVLAIYYTKLGLVPTKTHTCMWHAHVSQKNLFDRICKQDCQDLDTSQSGLSHLVKQVKEFGGKLCVSVPHTTIR